MHHKYATFNRFFRIGLLSTLLWVAVSWLIGNLTGALNYLGAKAYYSPSGSSFVLDAFNHLLILPLFAAVLGCLAGVAFALLRRFRLLYFSLIFLVAYYFGYATWRGLYDAAFMAGIERIDHNARPLIAALNQYELEHAAPPRNLETLVPHYLPAIPKTGMTFAPQFQYVMPAPEQKFDSKWYLEVRYRHYIDLITFSCLRRYADPDDLKTHASPRSSAFEYKGWYFYAD